MIFAAFMWLDYQILCSKTAPAARRHDCFWRCGTPAAYFSTP